MVNRSNKPSCFYYFIKRVNDIIFSLVVLTILLVPLLIVLLFASFETRCHPLYIDRRVGKNNKIIGVIKIRTMYLDAESNMEKYLNPSQIEQWKKERKVDNDPRETKIGKFLRKTSIDETPQFLNVLIGNMSLVGPRPITQFELDNNFSEEEKQLICSLKPGITGNWQIYGRSDDNWESGKRKRYIFGYYYNQSILLDLKIILLTVPSCFKFFFNDKR